MVAQRDALRAAQAVEVVRLKRQLYVAQEQSGSPTRRAWPMLREARHRSN